MTESKKTPACNNAEGSQWPLEIPELDVYDPKTLAVMDQAFAAIWAISRGPVRDYANDSELRIAVGRKLLNLVADGVTDPIRLRQLTVESLSRPGH